MRVTKPEELDLLADLVRRADAFPDELDDYETEFVSAIETKLERFGRLASVTESQLEFARKLDDKLPLMPKTVRRPDTRSLADAFKTRD